MSVQPDPPHSIGKQVHRAARRQLDKALKALRGRSKALKFRDNAIHTARKHLKQARALLRLMGGHLSRKAFNRSNRALRNAARPLSQARDSIAVIEALKSLLEHYQGETTKRAYAPLWTALRSRRTGIHRRLLGRDHALQNAASMIEDVRERMDKWDLRHESRKALLARLRETYRQGRKAMSAVQKTPSDERLHEWRKRAKDLRYQLELLEQIWPKELRISAKQANQLTDLLGDDHDLVILRGLLDTDFKGLAPGEIEESLPSLIERRRTELQSAAIQASGTLYAESPARFADRIRKLWKAAAIA